MVSFAIVQSLAAICLQVTAFWLLHIHLRARLLWQSMPLPWLSGRHSSYSIVVACPRLLPTAMRLLMSDGGALHITKLVCHCISATAKHWLILQSVMHV